MQAADIDGKPSHDDLRSLLRRAINPAEVYGPQGPYINEVGDGACVVSRDGKHYRYPYTVSADGRSVELGEPVEVHLAWQDTPVQAAEPTEERPAFVTDLRGLAFGDADTVEIEVCRDGSWHHARYGKIDVNPADAGGGGADPQDG